MTFYNYIENVRYEMFSLVNSWTHKGAETKARISQSLDQARYEYDQLKAENDKLQELSLIMLKCIKANERKALICWECPMHKQFDELRSYCCLEHEAKELGVEIGQ